MKAPLLLVDRREHVDRFQRIAELEHRVRQRPALDIRGPGHQRRAVPESHGLAVPLRDLLHVAPSDQDLAQEVGGGAGQELDLVRRHGELEIPGAGGLRPPAHESFRIAERGVPLRRIVDAFVIVLLHHVLLIRRREHGQDRADLVDRPPDPLGVCILGFPCIPPIPVRHRLPRVNGGAAGGLRARHQRVVVFLGGLVGVGTDDLLPRVIRAAVAPRRRARRIGADAARRPDIRDLTRRITPEVPLVRPEGPIQIEVFRREQIDRQRLHAGRRSGKCRRVGAPAVPRPAVPAPAALPRVLPAAPAPAAPPVRRAPAHWRSATSGSMAGNSASAHQGPHSAARVKNLALIQFTPRYRFTSPRRMSVRTRTATRSSADPRRSCHRQSSAWHSACSNNRRAGCRSGSRCRPACPPPACRAGRSSRCTTPSSVPSA